MNGERSITLLLAMLLGGAAGAVATRLGPGVARAASDPPQDLAQDSDGAVLAALEQRIAALEEVAGDRELAPVQPAAAVRVPSVDGAGAKEALERVARLEARVAVLDAEKAQRDAAVAAREERNAEREREREAEYAAASLGGR